MAKLTFANPLVNTYAGAISKMRTVLTEWAEIARKSPAIIPDQAAALAVLTANLGVTLPAAGTPGQPTSLSAVLDGTGAAVLLFAGGINTATYEYAVGVSASYGAWLPLAANRRVTGVTAGSTTFKVRGKNAAGTAGVESAPSVAVTIT